MRYIFSILFFILLFGCEQTSKSKFEAATEIKDSLNDARFIRQTQFDRKVINDYLQDVHEDSLIGTWTDSIILYYEKDKWDGWKPIDKINEITLYPSSKYQWKKINTYSKLDTVKYGQYWTSNIKDSSYLQLIFNSKGDTLFNQGDKGFVNSFLIDYYNNDTLLIRAFNTVTHEAKDEAHLMIRK